MGEGQDGGEEAPSAGLTKESPCTSAPLHALQLTAKAKTEGVSLNSLVLAFIAEGLGRRGSARA